MIKNSEQARSRWVIIAIFALALALRLSTLASTSLWLDEVATLQVAQQTTATILQNPTGEEHPPTFYLFLKQWIKLGESEYVLRFPSAIFGALSVLVAYWLGRAIGSIRFGIWLAFLLAIDPINLWYSQEVRPYALLTFIAVCGVFFTVRMLKRFSFVAWSGSVLALSAVMYVDYNGVIFWIILTAATLAVMTVLSRWTRSIITRWLIAQALIALLYIPLWSKAIGVIALVIQGNILENHGLLGVGVQIQLQAVPLALILFGLGLVLMIFVVGTWLIHHRNNTAQLFVSRSHLITFAIIIAYAAWLLLAAAPRFYSIKRVLMIYSPYVAAVAAYALISIQRRSIVYVVVGLATASAILNWIVWPREDWRSAASFVAQQAQPGDIIVGIPSYITYPFNYYYSNLNGTAQIISDSQLKKYPNQHVWLLIGNTYEQGSNSTLRRDLTQVRQTIGHWNLYQVEVLLLQ